MRIRLDLMATMVGPALGLKAALSGLFGLHLFPKLSRILESIELVISETHVVPVNYHDISSSLRPRTYAKRKSATLEI